VQTIRRAIEVTLPQQHASLEQVAYRLELSRAALKKTLKKRGLNFRALRDKVRFEMVVAYLETTDTQMADIGMLVGLSEENSFFRAFKRWTGETPAAYRRRRRGGAL